MLVQRQVTTRWENDNLWLQKGGIRDSGLGRVRVPPPDRNQAEGGEGQSGLRRVE